MMSFFKRIVLPIIALALLLSALPVTQVFAYNKYETFKEDLGWQAKSAWYYDAMYYCVSADHKVPTEKDYRIKFDSGDERSGFIMRDTLSTVGDKGKTKCNANDSELARKALAFWGIPELEFTCLFWKRSNGSGCNNGQDYGEFQSGKGYTNPAKTFSDYIKDKIYGNQQDPMTARNAPGAVKYIYHLESFKKGCAYNKTPLTSDPKIENDKLAYWIGQVEGDGKIEWRWYIGTKTHSDKVGFYTTGNEDWQCYDIAKFISPEGEYTKAYATWKKAHPQAKDTSQSGGSTGKKDVDQPSSCGIEGIGWVVCPGIEALAKVADGALGYLQDRFLVVDAKTFSTAPMKDENGADKKDEQGNTIYYPAYTAWMRVRTYANVAFVIAFIVIVYSQLTGRGINNYGVKKLLPRIVIAAILVNLSFFICQIAIDTSNVLGYGLTHLFEGIDIGNKADSNAAKATFVVVATTVLATTVVTSFASWALVAGAVLGAMVTLLCVWLILVARQAFILLLVVAAPLAFVAYLLPNTEGWFTKWRQALTGLLMVFPIVGLLFGVGDLASRILMASADETDIIAKLVALTVGVIPFVAVWPILKGSMNAVGNIGAKINGYGDRVSGKSKAWAMSAAAKSRLGKAQAFRAQQAQAKTEIGRYSGANPFRHAASFKNRIANKMPGAYNRHMRGQVAQFDQEAQTNAATTLQNSNLTAEQMHALALTNGKDKKFNKRLRKMGVNAKDASTRIAAIGVAGAQNSDDANLEIIAQTKERGDQRFNQAAAKMMQETKMSSRVAALGGDMIDKVATTGVDMNDIKAGAATAIEKGKYSVESAAGQSTTSLKLTKDVLQNGYTTVGQDGTPQQVKINAQQAEAFRKQAQQTLSDRDVSRKVTTAQANEIRDILRPPSRGGGAAEGQDFNVHGK